MSDNKALITEANKCARAVYLVTENIVADDISRILAGLVDALIKSERVIAEKSTKLAALMEWRHDWFFEPIEGKPRAAHLRRLDAILDGPPPVSETKS